MFHSIRWRLILSYVLLSLLIVSVVGVLALSLVRRYVEQQESEYLTANAEAVARTAWLLMWPVVRQQELQELAQAASFLGNARVRILGPESVALVDSGPRTGGDRFVWIVPSALGQGTTAGEPAQPFIVAVTSEHRVWWPISREDPLWVPEELPPGTAFTLVRRWDGMWGTRFRFDAIHESGQLRRLLVDEGETPRSEKVIVVPIGEERTVGYVEVSDGPDFAREALVHALRAFLIAAAGAMVVAAAVGLFESRRLSSPLRQLAGVAGEMSGGDLSTRAPVRRKDEIGQLAGQFNQMAERLETSFAELEAERDALRRFIADASHELRTPITALRSFNDLLQGAAADDPAARAEFLAESQAQIERLAWITGHLLDLSRLDAGLIDLDLGAHDAGDLIQGAVAPFKTTAREQDIDLSVRLPVPPLACRCDGARIVLALTNLLDNAFKFTLAGGRVEAGAEPADGGVRLWVRDTGCGIDPVDRPRIFERFYRGRDVRQEGSGLGLAIVQSIVSAHGGRVSVASEPGAGSLFTIDLPCG